MTIQEDDFKLELNDTCFDRFSLELLYVVNAKDPVKRREEFKEAGYDMTLETCLNKIINYRISKKQDIYTPKEYLTAYRAERLLLSELVKGK